MLKPSTLFSSISESPLIKGGRCLSCQFRFRNATSSPSLRYYASKSNGINDDAKKNTVKQSPSSTPPETPTKPTSGIQFKQNPSISPKQPGDEGFIPPSLDRPIGLVMPPQEGQNTGIDSRTIRQRRDDFVNYDRHLKRRKELYGVLYPALLYFNYTLFMLINCCI